MTTTLPDFHQWAENILRAPRTSHQSLMVELKQAFEQGMHYGRRTGTQEWWSHQDASYSEENRYDIVKVNAKDGGGNH